MKLVVGLGNPGRKYEKTRHNAGFLAIDRLIERWKAIGPSAKFNGQVFTCTLPAPGDESVMLLKPQTFMNASGESVAPIFKYYQCKITDLVVIHDELDLPRASLRIKTGGGAGGHRGIQSIDLLLGLTSYHRVRIGIGRPEVLEGVTEAPPVVDHVLQKFDAEELKSLDPLLDRVGDAVEKILAGQIIQAMNIYNRSER